MVVTVEDIMQTIEAVAPMHLAESWDNIGLQVGAPTDTVKKVLIALTPSRAVVEEALAVDADLLLTHHPFIFKGPRSLRSDEPLGYLATMMLRHGLAHYCAHTNLDVARGGVNDVLARAIGLEHTDILRKTSEDACYKLITFVPEDALETVREALFEAGAGSQGAYDRCAWQVSGEGSFRPLNGADPHVGRIGADEQVTEVRLEVLVNAKVLGQVIQALLNAHPYEEVAYDVFRQAHGGQAEGIGRVGVLAEPMSEEAFIRQVMTGLGLSAVRSSHLQGRTISKVGLCGGAAVEYLDDASAKGCDAYITGDAKFHDMQHADDCGVLLVDAGHYGTERPALEMLQRLLALRYGDALEVVVSNKEEDFIVQHIK